jgi:hypothetical protein
MTRSLSEGLGYMGVIPHAGRLFGEHGKPEPTECRFLVSRFQQDECGRDFIAAQRNGKLAATGAGTSPWTPKP